MIFATGLYLKKYTRYSYKRTQPTVSYNNVQYSLAMDNVAPNYKQERSRSHASNY